MKKLLLAIIVCSLVLFATAGTASASTPSLKSLAKSLAALQKQVHSLSGKLASANTQHRKRGLVERQRRLRQHRERLVCDRRWRGESGAYITESNEDGWAVGNSGTAVGQVETPKYEAH